MRQPYSYDAKTKLYRKQIKNPRGAYINVYGHTPAELAANVEAKISAWQADACAAADPYVFEYASAWYRRRCGSLSDQAKKVYGDEINRIICPAIGHLKLSKVTTDDIADVMAPRRGLSRSAQKRTILVLKQLFDAAFEAGKIDKDPTRKLRAQGKPAEKKRALTPEQQDTLLAAVAELSVRPFVMIGLYAGLRREEILGLRWDCVQLDGAAPHIIVRRALRWPERSQPEVNELLKSDAANRTVPIPPQLVDCLRPLLDAQLAKLPKKSAALQIRSRHVIVGRDGSPLSYSAYQSRWESVRARSTGTAKRERAGHDKPVEVVKRLGDVIPNHKIAVTIDFPVTPHILRHTYITRLIKGGVDLKTVQYLAGHSDPKITIQIYTDVMGHEPEDMIGDILSVFSPQNS